MNYNKENALAIKNYYENQGLPPASVCGMLGNIRGEAGEQMNSDNAENKINKYLTDAEYTQQVDNGTYACPLPDPKYKGKDFVYDGVGYGLIQWTFWSRKQGLLDYVKSKSVSISNRTAQLEYSIWELTNCHKDLWKRMLDAKDAGDIAVDIMVNYEKPASVDDPSARAVRASYANEFYEIFYGSGEKPKVLAISAGHYLYTPGKRCAKQLDPNETREWVLNARIADKLTVILNRYKGIKILRLDDPTGEKAIKIEERAQISDFNNADFYLAIHHNAVGRIFDGGGVVVYHYHYERNKVEATAMYNSLIAHNGLRGNRSNPIANGDNLYEVWKPQADSLLIENGFMDSTHDVPIILTDTFAQQSAEGMAEFFVNFWNLELKEEESKADILAEIESIDNNIAALQKRRAELEALL